MSLVHPDPDRIALGIRQPWAELILRGIKTIEIRVVETRCRGIIYLYSGAKYDNRSFAQDAAKEHQLDLSSLPLGKVVGSVEIVDCRPVLRKDTEGACVPFKILESKQAWLLRNPERFPPLSVTYRPFGIWFYPWKRLKEEG